MSNMGRGGVYAHLREEESSFSQRVSFSGGGVWRTVGNVIFVLKMGLGMDGWRRYDNSRCPTVSILRRRYENRRSPMAFIPWRWYRKMKDSIRLSREANTAVWWKYRYAAMFNFSLNNPFHFKVKYLLFTTRWEFKKIEWHFPLQCCFNSTDPFIPIRKKVTNFLI